MKAVGPDFSLFTPELDLEIWKTMKALCRKWIPLTDAFPYSYIGQH